MSISRKALVGAIATATVAGLAFGIAPAQANPAAGTNPVIDLFGSDTTQDVSNGFAAVIKNGSGQAVIASYDATSAGTSVTPGEVSPTVTVPVANGSGQGKTLLTAAINGTSASLTNFGTTLTSSGALSRDDVEVARSSSAGSWNANGVYAYIPFAIDAVTYATGTVGGVATAVPNGIPLGTTVGQNSDTDSTPDLTLRNIYGLGSGTITLEVGTTGTTRTVGAEGSGAQVIPFIPQAGSGTRSFWTTAIGGTLSNRVEDKFGASNTDVQEHDGTVVSTVANALVPFSIAQYISQNDASSLSADYGVTVANRINGANLNNVGSASPLDIDGNLNASFPINRAVFNIVENAAIDSSITTDVPDVYNATLVDLFVGSSAKVLTAVNPNTGESVIEDFGFAQIPAAGITPLDNKLYVAGTAYRSN
jgi:hypothetical protein